MTPPKPATILAQLGHYIDPATGGLVPPLQPSTTFARTPDYALVNPAHTYGRDDNPGYPQVEAVLCAIEGGAEALVFPSGMAAIAALFRTARRGEKVIVQRPIYYGTLAWLAWLGLHILYLAGLRNRASVLLNWAWGYLTWDRGPRIILRRQPDKPADAATERAKTAVDNRNS